LSTRLEVDRFFAGNPVGLEAYARMEGLLARLGPYEVRVTRSQVAFRGRRGFAYLWLPDRWLRGEVSPVVLSIGLDRPIRTARFKEVVQPAPSRWMHHLEISSANEIDEEVSGWLADAYRWGG
jgi:hypothetical protein